MATKQVSKQLVLDTMKRFGLRESLAEAERELPDPVDVDRDRNLLAKYGLEHNQLIDRMGGSP